MITLLFALTLLTGINDTTVAPIVDAFTPTVVGATLPRSNFIGAVVAEAEVDGRWQEAVLFEPKDEPKDGEVTVVSSWSGNGRNPEACYGIIVPHGAGQVRLRATSYTAGRIAPRLNLSTAPRPPGISLREHLCPDEL